MPLQNTIHGPVIETLDCLLGTNAEAGPSTPCRGLESYELDEPVIIGDLDLPIRHCLVAKAGVTIEEIKWVRSHEQVGHYLSYRFFSAENISGPGSIIKILVGASAPCQN